MSLDLAAALAHLSPLVPSDERSQVAWATVQACLTPPRAEETCPRCGEPSDFFCTSGSGIRHCGCYGQEDEEVCPTCQAPLDGSGEPECDCPVSSLIADRSSQDDPRHSEAFTERFLRWWEHKGQYVRAGGGDYERTFAYEAACHFAVAQPTPLTLEEEARARLREALPQMRHLLTDLQTVIGPFEGA